MVPPQILSVDDFALRKRQTYDTILVDLEHGRPLALLPDREAETVAQWLREHSGVEVVVRERAEAARLGAPTACQVADRFHLLQNLADVLTDVFRTHTPQLARTHAQDLAVPPPLHDPAAPATGLQPLICAARPAPVVHRGGTTGLPAAHPAMGPLPAGVDLSSAGEDP